MTAAMAIQSITATIDPMMIVIDVTGGSILPPSANITPL